MKEVGKGNIFSYTCTACYECPHKAESLTAPTAGPVSTAVCAVQRLHGWRRLFANLRSVAYIRTSQGTVPSNLRKWWLERICEEAAFTFSEVLSQNSSQRTEENHKNSQSILSAFPPRLEPDTPEYIYSFRCDLFLCLDVQWLPTVQSELKVLGKSLWILQFKENSGSGWYFERAVQGVPRGIDSLIFLISVVLLRTSGRIFLLTAVSNFCRFKMTANWSKKFLAEFVGLYRSLECIWNMKSED